MDNKIKKLQDIELDILKSVLDIISRHQITYYMLGGTLLGAVRHQGFIPWDDDIDIGMPRPEYERFLSVAEQELSFPYEIQTGKNKKGVYQYYYARVVNTQILLNRTKTEASVIIPAWIDIFPLDGVPSKPFAFRFWKLKCKLYYFLYRFSQYSYFFTSNVMQNKSYSHVKRITLLVLHMLHFEKSLDKDKLWALLDKELKKNDYNFSSKLINFCGIWGIKEMFPKSVYGNGRLFQFEDLMLNGPADYATVLTQMYGDFMTPPPEAKRDHHSVELIES